MKPVFGVRTAEVYLDNAATTMIDPDVFDAMRPFIEENYGDHEAGQHHLGRQAKEAMGKAREQVTELLGCKADRVFFTSGGTEANNWALKGFPSVRIVISAIESPSVAKSAAAAPLCTLKVVPVDSFGQVRMDELEKTLNEGPVKLVSIQYANGEVGTVQPIKDIAAMVHARGAVFHVDAEQAFGKIPVIPEDDGIDLLSISAHKIHGPKGVGALYIKEGISLAPLIHGGSQEGGMRAGTIPVHQVVGFGMAAEKARCSMKVEEPRQRALLKKLSVSLTEMAKGVRNGHPEKCLPNILNMRFPVDAFMLATTLNKEYGICVSCGSRKSSLSPVLKVLGQTDAHASQAIRISLSRHTTEEHIRFLLGCIQPAIKMALARSAS